MDAEVCAVSPSDWDIRSIGDVCARVTSGGTPSRRKPEFYHQGTWAWVKTQELQDKWIDDTEEHITQAAVDSSSAKPLPANTVLVALYGATVGQLGLLRRSMACNQACSALIVDPERVNHRFLFYQLLYAKPQLKRLATGAAQQNLSGILIKSLRFPFPLVEEQRSIAHILGTLDDKIELNRQMNKTLEEIARTLFKSWFMDFDPVHAKAEGRETDLPPEVDELFPEDFASTGIGETPVGWKASPLSSIINIFSGGTPKTSVMDYWNGSIPWYSIRDAPADYDLFVIQTEKAITQTGIDNSAAQILSPGTTIISARGTVGKLAITGLPLAINQSCFGLQGKKGLGNFFTYYMIRSAIGNIQRNTHGSVFDTINRKTFDHIHVIVPPAPLCEVFESKMAPIFTLILNHRFQTKTLTTLRDTLLPKLISGELRVPATVEVPS